MVERKDPRRTLSLVSDELWDFLGGEECDIETFSRIDGALDGAMMVMCEQLGHEPVPDQCGIPEHDYCMWCQYPTPGRAERIKK